MTYQNAASGLRDETERQRCAVERQTDNRGALVGRNVNFEAWNIK